MIKKLTIAVVGVGAIGVHHIRNLKTIPSVGTILLVEVEKGRRENAVRIFGCPAYESVRTLLKNHTLDAAVVAVPTKLHYRVASALLKRGIPTLVEKPITATIQEAEMLVRLAKTMKTVLAVGHVERFNAAVRKVKTLLDKGEIGAIVSILARRVGPLPPKTPDTNVIIDLAVHDIDIFFYLLKKEPQKISATGGKSKLRKFEDHADISLEYPGGTTGFIQVNWITPVKIRTLSITGTKGHIELDYITQTIEVIHSTSKDFRFDSFGRFILQSGPTRKTFFAEGAKEPLREELLQFIEDARANKMPENSGEIGLKAIRIAQKATDTMNVHTLA